MSSRGFTLIEVLVALAVFATLTLAFLTLTRQSGSSALQTRASSELTRTLAGTAQRVRLGDPTYLHAGLLPDRAVQAAVNPPPATPVHITLTALATTPPRWRLTGTTETLTTTVTVTAPGGTP